MISGAAGSAESAALTEYEFEARWGTPIRRTASRVRQAMAAASALGALQLDGYVDERERGRRDAGNAAGLADGHGADALQRFAHLAGEAADGAVFEPTGDGDGLGSFESFDGFLLLLEVAGELDFGFDGAGFVAESGAGDGGRRNPPSEEPPHVLGTDAPTTADLETGATS